MNRETTRTVEGGAGCAPAIQAAHFPDKQLSRGTASERTPGLSVSVIVATRNRTAALRDICLPALAQQETRAARELIVCDASDDRTTEELIGAWSAAHPDWPTLYLRAERAGTCSQRNQATAAAQGDVVLFLDDDLELLPGALDELMDAFRRDGGRKYAGFGCTLVEPPETSTHPGHSRIRQVLWRGAMHLFGLPTGRGAPVVLPSGFPDGTDATPRSSIPDLRTCPHVTRDVEWLGGCCMAFRRTLFVSDNIWFDTQLERFSGYALAEDILLCVTVRKRTGRRLGQCSAALAVHYAVSGGRGSERARGAALAYNIWHVWSAAGPSTPARRFQWLRGQAGHVAISFRHGGLQRLQGLIEGWRAIVQEMRDPGAVTGQDGPR